MPCYYPIKGYRQKKGRDKKTGRWPIVFRPGDGYRDMEVIIPCGQCVGCRLERSRQHAIRCVHEAKMHEDNCFLTLTYNNESLLSCCGMYDEEYGCITDFTVNPVEFKRFIRRIRDKYGKEIRYFHCAEYGEENQRPHHHALLFGHDYPDKVLYQVKYGQKLYESPTLDREWGNGKCIIGELSFESAAYTARYVMKKVNGEKHHEHYKGRSPEVVTMSRKPGIGKRYYDKYGKDYREKDFLILNGLKMRPPRYYDKIWDELDRKQFNLRKEMRHIRGKEKGEKDSDRLLVMEKVKKTKVKKLVREI